MSFAFYSLFLIRVFILSRPGRANAPVAEDEEFSTFRERQINQSFLFSDLTNCLICLLLITRVQFPSETLLA